MYVTFRTKKVYFNFVMTPLKLGKVAPASFYDIRIKE